MDLESKSCVDSSTNHEICQEDQKKTRFSKRQWIMLLVFASMNFISTTCLSVQAPFYPAEAEKKGASISASGFVFAIAEFTVFLSSPIFGSYLSVLGPKTVFTVCVMIASISTISFGLLDKVNDPTWFIALSLLCRFIEGVGCGGFLPATFTIITIEFPDSVALVFSSLETFAGAGDLLGPAIGAALFTIGGFTLPFVSMGVALFLSALLCCCVMPRITVTREKENEKSDDDNFGIWEILKLRGTWLAALCVALVTMFSGMIRTTLEPHIRQFQLSPIESSSFFIIFGGVYAVTSPFWGYACDHMRRPVYIAISGIFLNVLGFLLIGPAPFMPFDTIMWVTITGLFLQGLGLAACMVSGFVVIRKEAIRNGYPDNLQTNGIVSGIWQSMASLGAWSGPAIAGILYDQIGFKNTTLVPLSVSFAVGIIMLIHAPCSTTSMASPQSEPLISTNAEEGQEGENKPSTKSYGSINEVPN